MTHENHHHDEHRGPEHDQSLPAAETVQVFANVEDSLSPPLTEDIDVGEPSIEQMSDAGLTPDDGFEVDDD